MSSPANRTALREEENRPAPPSQQVIASAVTGPTPYSRAASTLAPVRLRAACQQPVPQHVQAGLQRGEHAQGGGHLQLPGRRQVRRGRRAQRLEIIVGAQRGLAQGRGALVEEHRMDALHPGGVLGPQVVIGLQQRPALQDDRRRDPALRQPALGQQLPQVPRVGSVGLGVPLAAAGERGVSRLGDMRRDASPGQLLRDVPPAGAPLQRERDVIAAGEPRQPGPQMHPVGRGDLAALHLPGRGVQIVERELLPVNVEPAYDGHRDLLKLRRGHSPHAKCLRSQS